MPKLRAAASISTIGLLISISLLIGVGALFRYDSANQIATARWVEHTHEVIETLNQIILNMGEAETRMRIYVVSHEEAQYEGFIAAVGKMRQAEQSALRLVADNPTQERKLQVIGPELTHRLEFLYERAMRARNGLPDVQRPEGVALSLRIRTEVGEMKAQEMSLLRERQVKGEALQTRMLATAYTGIGVAIALVVLVFAVLRAEVRIRQNAERRAQENSAILQSVADNTIDGIYVKDNRGRYQFMNKACADYVNSTPQDVIGKDDRDLLNAEYARYIIDRDNLVFQTRRPQTTEDISPAPDGKGSVVFLTTKTPLFDETGAIKGLVGISREITDRKAAEAERLRESTVLLQTGEWLQSCRSLDDAYEVVTRMVPDMFPELASGALYCFPPSRAFLERKATWGENPAFAARETLSADDCWALRRGQIHYLEDASKGMRCAHTEGTQGQACFCLPLLAHGELLGALQLTSNRAMDEALRRRINAFGEQLSMALGNLILRETLRAQSIRDPLTGLFNRRYLEETFERELRRVARDNQPLSLLVLDVDHFKRFNDTFGHAAGDDVLRAVGVLLKECTRGSDIASRIGGEELSMLLPGASLEDATKKAEQVRQGISALEVRHLDRSLGQITVSIGVSSFPTHGKTLADLFRCADEALYEAKRSGRNRVIVGSTTAEN